MRKKGFSLIEVLFAIVFLILVGVAMAALNNAAARLTETTELKQMALGLNEQSIAFVALEKRTKGAAFAAAYPNCVAGQTCYVVCPTGVSPNCTLQLQNTKATLQIGTSKLQFEPRVVIRPTGTSYLVNATTAWGSGGQKQLTTARIIE
jgi:Tfp pilus assembly protein PilX